MSPVPAASIPPTRAPTPPGPVSGTVASGWDRYWFDPVPVRRVDVFARIIAVVVACGWCPRTAGPRCAIPRSSSTGRCSGRVLHLPAPTPTTMLAVQVLVVVGGVDAHPPELRRRAVTLVSYGCGCWRSRLFCFFRGSVSAGEGWAVAASVEEAEGDEVVGGAEAVGDAVRAGFGVDAR